MKQGFFSVISCLEIDMKTILVFFLALASALAEAEESLTDHINRLAASIRAADEAAANYQETTKSFNIKNYKLTEDEEEYDFIIVGGGSAGSLLAARLAYRSNFKVLLLEAGGLETEVSKIPAMKDNMAKSEMNWNFTSVPNNKSCLGFVDNICTIRSGKALGGSSAINDMINQIGEAFDYKPWEEVYPDWGFSKLVYMYMEIKSAFVQNEDHPEECYNTHGPMKMENPRYYPLGHDELLAGALEMGMHDTLTGCQMVYNNGIGFYRVLTDQGERLSSASAFLKPVFHKANLKISLNSHVVKLIIENGTVKGVQYTKNDKLITSRTKKEVILTAGSVNTAQILHLSGIGPKSIQKLGIDLVADLPIGERIKTAVSYFGAKFLFKQQFNRTTRLERDIFNYLVNKNGPLTAIKGGADIVGYLNVTEPKEQTQLSIYITPGVDWFNNDDNRLKPSIRKLRDDLEGKQGFFVGIVLFHPKSTGRIRLKDNDPFHKPLVDVNILDDEEDVETILKGVKWALKFAGTEAMKTFKGGNEVYAPDIEGCPRIGEDEDGYWRCSIRHFAVPSNRDIVGAARMGTPDDPESVVDNKLRVYGVRNLRIADVNVVPVTLTADVTKPSIIIAERCARWILSKYIVA